MASDADPPTRNASGLRGDGWIALADGRWEAARDAFQDALAAEETPEALEGMSWAAWWLDDAPAVFEARERSFRLYRRRDDALGAARMATWLAADQLDFRGALAVTRGWLGRARRLLEPLEPGPDHGWLAFHEGYVASIEGETARSLELAERAAELGRHFRVPDLEMLGLALQGAVLVARGEVREGMALLDEATVVALAGEATIPISGAWACCFLVSACESVRDYERAFAWCDRIAEFAERYGSRYMLGFCRAHYASVHMWRGQWPEAEAELEAAVEAYVGSRPAFVPQARAQLVELYRREGRWDEAERLLDEAGPDAALLVRARLALDRGQTRRARDLAERVLRRLPAEAPLRRAPALELLVQACAARGDLDGASAALEELREVAARAGTEPLEAAADLAAGIVAAARGAYEEAKRWLEDAGDGFARSGAPFEAAQARLELATSLLALDRPDEAAREAGASLDQLTALGAAAEAERARRILEQTRSAAAAPPQRARVTDRERDVLRCLVEGLTNRQIAERLSISEHTVHRHVTNILRKLDVPSRSAAAAHAVHAGLAEPPTR